MSEHMPFVYDDGGRKATGRKGDVGDCVCRAIVIATQRPYQEVYDALAAGSATQRTTRRSIKSTAKRRTARNGIYTRRKWFRDYMTSLGWEWVPTMKVGEGCKVHLVAGELPPGRLIVSVSKHYTAVIDGVVHDTYDPQRRVFWYDSWGKTERVSERCVYGYWRVSS
jgi:hypothetical protein